MAAVIVVGDVQAWLEATKLTLGVNFTADQLTLEQVAQTKVFAALSPVYSTTTWVDSGSTPQMVRNIIAMYTAAYLYNKQYSEDDPTITSYGTWLIGMADGLIAGLIDGSLSLSEVPNPSNPTNPSYYPDDTTGAVVQYDALGYPIGYAGSEDIKFRMGARF